MVKWFNKRGSTSIFLTFILVAMLSASIIFVYAARTITSASYCDAVLNLAGRSVLSEFDNRLKKEYGIFAFYGFENQVESRMRFYSKESLDGYRVKLQSVNASLSSHSIMNVDVFEEAIEAYMKFMIAEKGINAVSGLWNKENVDSSEARVERTLNNNAEISSLPSKGLANNGINLLEKLEKGLPSPSKVLEQGTTLYRTNEYILSHFKYRVGGDKAKETFFENEVEYILYGKLSDAANQKAFRSDFKLLRTGLNSAHIYGDASKRNAAMALAEIMTPGPEAIITQAIIIAAWAAAEAENDARLLMAGKNVAFTKTNADWALGLKAAMDGLFGNGYVTPASDGGLSYKDYLRMFLYFENREMKLMRMMDLIQLNLRGSYYEDFLIKNYHSGFTVEAQIAGKRYHYEQKY